MERICPCKRTGCSRHGDCAACRAHHLECKGDSPTACERIARKEERRRERGASAGPNGKEHR